MIRLLRLSAVAATVATGALWQCAAHAQQRPPTTSLVLLARNEAVQREIELDGARVAAVKNVVVAYTGEMAEEMETAGLGVGSLRELQKLTEEERDKKLKERAEKQASVFKKVNGKFVPQLRAVISAAQFERLQQVAWQDAGSRALANDSDLAAALQLQPDQVQRIERINQEFQRRQRGLAGGPASGDAQKRWAKIRELDNERDSRALEVLDKEQQAKFAMLKGKPFDVSQLVPR